MDSIVTVFLLGLSAEGLVICPFFAFGLTLADRLAGVRFLSGRIIGLICFGLVISLLGKSVSIKEEYIDITFGILIIILGVYRICKSYPKIEFLSEVKNKPVWGIGSKCHSADGHNSKGVGFFLGLSRGLLNPGRKYVYLAPLLIGVGAFKGIALSFVFGISSSIYLLIGFLSAGLIEKLTHYKRTIGFLGGIILIIIGIVYGWKGIEYLVNT